MRSRRAYLHSAINLALAARSRCRAFKIAGEIISVDIKSVFRDLN
jgi:hypothetical protein